jgi:hypothetical protein
LFCRIHNQADLKSYGILVPVDDVDISILVDNLYFSSGINGKSPGFVMNFLECPGPELASQQPKSNEKQGSDFTI